jgi:hypothetical protein
VMYNQSLLSFSLRMLVLFWKQFCDTQSHTHLWMMLSILKKKLAIRLRKEYVKKNAFFLTIEKEESWTKRPQKLQNLEACTRRLCDAMVTHARST